MDIKVCRDCRKIFNYIAGEMRCPACKQKLEDKFQDVKEYIRTHKNCSVKDVCEECEIPSTTIEKWIRQERLIFANKDGLVSCEKCGCSIPSGRFCGACKKSIINTLN